MEWEGVLELSLGCLQDVVRKKTDSLTFPLILQVLECTDCRSRSKNERHSSSQVTTMITVSDGFYKKQDCFLLTTTDNIDPYSIIRVSNVDFECAIERPKDRPRVAGMILEYTILRPGAQIGYFSGKPKLLRDERCWRPVAQKQLDHLSQKLWKQVKEERCCDVRFTFPNLPGEHVVLAQRNALIANSPVFEAQFEGDFSDATGNVSITDSEPVYMRCVLQFIFTRFVPLLCLKQAFEILYLAKKYIIPDLESYCKAFIMNNNRALSGVTDVFEYFELNQKCRDDEVDTFVWQQFRNQANVLMRQPRFTELDLPTLEQLMMMELNCHEWELVQAVRRWAVANNAGSKCHTEDSRECVHQLLECIRWETMPVKEAVLVASWPEFGLQQDVDFLPNLLQLHQRKEGRGISHTEVVPATINRLYSLNRQYNNENSFVIYTNLFVDPVSLNVSCLHGHAASKHTLNQTRCPTIGNPFELKSFFMVPSYSLSSPTNSRVRLTVNLACLGKSFSAEPDSMWTRSMMVLTVFSFSPSRPAKEHKKEVNFWPDRDSSITCSVTISRSEFNHYLHQQDGKTVMDLQMRFITDYTSDEIAGERAASPPKIIKPLRPTASTSNDRRGRMTSPPPPRAHNPIPHYSNSMRTTYDSRIDTSVGRTVSLIRKRRWSPELQDHYSDFCDDDGFGDVNRSPQSHEYRSYRSPSFSPPSANHPYNNTIEVQSPEYSHTEGYGNVNRSPQCNHHSPVISPHNPWMINRPQSPDCSSENSPAASPLPRSSPTFAPDSPTYHHSPEHEPLSWRSWHNSPQQSPSLPLLSHLNSPLHDAETPASPPRNSVSPILFINSPASPQYHPAPSPPVIDLDIEEPQEEVARPIGEQEELVEVREEVEEMEQSHPDVSRDMQDL